MKKASAAENTWKGKSACGKQCIARPASGMPLHHLNSDAPRRRFAEKMIRPKRRLGLQKLNFELLKDDSNIDNFLMTNYMYDNFDEKAVKESLELLRPDNMWGYY